MQRNLTFPSVADHGEKISQLMTRLMTEYANYSPDLQLSLVAYRLYSDQKCFYTLQGTKYRVNLFTPLFAGLVALPASNLLQIHCGKKQISLSPLLKALQQKTAHLQVQYNLPTGIKLLVNELSKKIKAETEAREEAELQLAIELSRKEEEKKEASRLARKKLSHEHSLAYHAYFFGSAKMRACTVIPSNNAESLKQSIQNSIEDSYQLPDGSKHVIRYDSHFEDYLLFLRQKLQFNIAFLFNTARSDQTNGSYSSSYFKPKSKLDALLAVCTSVRENSMSIAEILETNEATADDAHEVKKVLSHSQNKHFDAYVQAECDSYLQKLETNKKATAGFQK
ncbi:MAG: hypothetical protein P4M14_01410 [Gammaproteobacteria bacterium]|nr:hypothetical protein [Gammaproteobacteria bacterium]